MGVGKTTLIDGLARALSRKKTAILDCDALSMTYPGGAVAERLQLVEDNLVACAQNFDRWGADYLCTCWVFLQQRRLDETVARLERNNIPTLTVALVAPPEICCERILRRQRTHNFDAAARRWLEEVADASTRLRTDIALDASAKTPYDLVTVTAEQVKRWDALSWATQ